MNLSSKNNKQPSLALFFTAGNSLEIWNKVGNLSRELELYKKLANRFGRIYFFTYGTKKDLAYKHLLPDNIEIIPKKINLPHYLYMLLIPLLERNKLKNIDIYKTNQIKGAVAAVLAKKLYKKKLIVRGGYEWLSFAQKQNLSRWKLFLIRAMERFSYNNADKIIISYQYGKDFIKKEFNISEDKIVLNPNYIDTELFRPMPEIKKEKDRIICVAKLHPQKNLDNLIRAIAGLNVRLIIYGEGPIEKRLKKLAQELNSQVKFRGKIPNEQLPQELNRSEFFILPSVFESKPKTLLEAMSCGLPCIATDIIGINDVITHKQNGYLTETDANSLRNAIKEVLSDQNLQHTMGQNARDTIVNIYSLQKILETELNVYEQL